MSYVVDLYAVLLVLLFVPGLLVGAAAGLRGWLLAACAPVLTYGVIAMGGPIAPAIFGRWSVGVFALTTVVVALVLFGVRLVARRWQGGTLRVGDGDLTPWQRWQHLTTAGAIVVTAAIGIVVVARATANFTDVHQFWDAQFHSNAVRFIAETGQSQPSALRAIDDPTMQSFYYPNAFHVLMASAHLLVSGSISTLLNVQAGLQAGIFALGVVTLVRTVGGRPMLAVSVGVAAGMFSAFPFDMAFFGPLWPFATGVSMVPAFMALFVHMVKVRHPVLVVAVALGMCGMALVHSSIAVTVVIFAVCFVVQRWVTARRIPIPELVVVATSGVLAAFYVLPQLLSAAGNTSVSAFQYPYYGPPADALGELLFLSHPQSSPQVWLVLAMVLGLVRLRQLGRNLGWWLAGGVIFSGLFVISTSFKGPFYQSLTDIWWDDRWRFAALVALSMVVLAGHGIVVARDLLLKLMRTLPELATPRTRVAMAGVVLLLLAGLTKGMYVGRNTLVVAGAYTNGPTVSKLELEAMSELPSIVHPGALVMNDSADGSPWMFSLDGVVPVFPVPWNATPSAAEVGADRHNLYLHFNQLDTNPNIRAAVERLKITYVYVGTGFVAPGITRQPGLVGLNHVKSLILVYSNDDAQIYRIDLGVHLTAGSTP
ncbi:MAG TPA: DUF6541 family protein [Pseudonocardiaceae bacterium]|nr:DUF6541 family protein [Pseudonocardiaceae bacterium]